MPATRTACYPFKGLNDVCRRVVQRTMNKRVVDSPIKKRGAMDERISTAIGIALSTEVESQIRALVGDGDVVPVQVAGGVLS